MSLYCGNNARSPELRKGGKIIGNRYQCFKKGVGLGLSQPYDPAYASRYVPIDGRRIYCGTANRLPAGYDILGNSPMCLQKGVGVGKVQKAKKIRKGKKKRKSKRKSRSRRKSRRRSRSRRRRKSKSRSKRRKSR